MPFGGPQKLTIAFLFTIYSQLALANIGVFVGSGNSDETSGEKFDPFLNAIEPYFPCLRKDDATCHEEVKSPYSLGLSWDGSKQDILIKDGGDEIVEISNNNAMRLGPMFLIDGYTFGLSFSTKGGVYSDSTGESRTIDLTVHRTYGNWNVKTIFSRSDGIFRDFKLGQSPNYDRSHALKNGRLTTMVVNGAYLFAPNNYNPGTFTELSRIQTKNGASLLLSFGASRHELVSDQSFLDDVTFNGQSFQNSKKSLRITAVKFGPGYGLSLTHNNFYLSFANDMGIALIAIDDEVKLGLRLSGDLGVGYRTENWGCGFHGSVEQLDFRHEDLKYEVGHVSGKYFAAVYF